MALKLTQNGTGKAWSSSKKDDEEKKTTGATTAPARDTWTSGKLTLTKEKREVTPIIQQPKEEERGVMDLAADYLTGWAKRQAAGHAGTAESLLEGTRRADMLNSSEYRRAQQERENAAHYREMIRRGTMDDGTVIDDERRKWLEDAAARAENRAGVYDAGNEAIHQPISGLIEQTETFGDRMERESEKQISGVKDKTGVVGDVLLDAGLALGDVLTDAAGNLILPGLGTAGRVSRTYGSGAERAEEKGFDLGKQALYGAAAAAIGEGTNRIFSSNPILKKAAGSGALDDLILPGLEKSLPGSIVKSGLGEALEEGTENVIDYFAQKAILGDKADAFSWKDVGYDALIGGLVGGVTGVSRPKSTEQGSETPVTEKTTSQDGAGAREKNSEGSFTPEAKNASEGHLNAISEVEAENDTANVRASTLGAAKQTLGERGYRAFEAAFREDGDPAVSYQELSRAYNEGMANRRTGSRVLTEAQYDAMYEAGRADAAASIEAQAKKAGYVTVHGEDSGLVYDDYVENSLDDKTAKVINTVAKALGVKVQFADSVAGGQANAEIQNGIVTIEKGNPNPVRFLFGHEITHRMQEVAPAEYARLREAVTAGGWADAAIKRTQKLYARHGKTITSEAALDEAVADYVGSMLEDSGELERFIREHQDDRTLLQKLRDAFRELGRKLRGSQYDKQIRNVEKRLSEALDASVKAVEKRGGQAYTGVTETKHSLKEATDYDRERAGESAGVATEERPDGSRGEAVQGTDGEDGGRSSRGVLGTLGLRASFGQIPGHEWARDGVIAAKEGTVVYAEQQIAMEYGVPSFVIRDAVWRAAGYKEPAFSRGGQIYFRETQDEEVRGLLAYHELTHVMKEVGYKPYLGFVRRTPTMLYLDRPVTNALLDRVAKQRNVTRTKDMPLEEKRKLYDEFNASLYAKIASGQVDEFRPILNAVFRDFDYYAAELTEIHQKFKASRAAIADQASVSYDSEMESFAPAKLSLKDSESLAREIARIQKEGRAQKRSKADVQADIRKTVEEAYSGMIEEYGAIESGENPVRDVQVPKKTGKQKVSQTVRTAVEAAATPDEALPNIEQMVATGDFSYDAYTDRQAIADATRTIKSVGWAQALIDWTKQVKNGEVSKKNTAMGWALYNNAVNSGDTKTALTVLENMIQHQRNAAQALQATRILKTLSPETQLFQIQRSVKNLQKELNKRYGDKKAPKIVIPKELADRYRKAQTQEERDEVMKDIYRDVGRQMPSRFIDKWNAWRYLAMLGNPRTHVRNVAGNLFFAPVVAVKNLMATGIEAAVSRVSGGKLERSKSMVGLSKGDRALLQAAWNDFSNVQETALSGGKYSEFANANKYIEEGRQVFKNKVLEKARKGNSKLLDREDLWFSRPHYAAAMASYCKQHGLTAEQIQRGKETKNARAYAIREAQKATYRDATALSHLLSARFDEGGEFGMAGKVGNMVVEGVLPFRKTPANILARGIEYSPIGLLNGIKQGLLDVRKGTKTGAEAIDSISAGLTGTGLLALGLYMAAQGLVRGHGSGDDNEKEYEELQGHQAYSLEVDGKSYTLDWLAPEALPFFVGVNLWEQGKMEDGEMPTMADWQEAIYHISEPLLEMSCLQSLNDMIDSVSYSQDSGLIDIASSIATSYITQAFPTLFGQIERIGEDLRYTTYTEENSFLTGDQQYTLGKISGKTPGEFQQIPYIDAWGRTKSTGTVTERAVNNLVNPAYVSQIESSDMEEELLRLYEATGEAGVLPSRAAKYFNVGGARKDLTAEEYVKYATKKGQTSYSLLAKMTKTSAYKAMDDAEKAEAVAKVYEYANAVAKATVSNYKPDGWVAKAIKTGKDTGIKLEQYVPLYLAQSGVESLKDADGEAMENSRGLLVMQLIYNTTGLTEAQRKALFEDFGVGKKVQHYNRARVDRQLERMRKKTE